MRIIVLYAVVVLVWGSTWAVIPFQFGPVADEVSVAYRFAIASVALFIFGLITRRQLRIPAADYPSVMLTGALMFSANYLFTYYAIHYITSGLVAVIFSMMVVTNAFFERLFFKTVLENRLMLAAAAGLAGMICLFWPEVRSFSLQDDAFVGVLLTLIAVLLASLGNMAAINCGRRNVPVVAVNAHGMAWGALMSLVVALARGHEINFSTETPYIASLLYLSLVGSALVFGCYIALMRSIGAARAAYSTVLFPIVALLISTVVEDYQWSSLAIAGVLCILFGNWLVLGKK